MDEDIFLKKMRGVKPFTKEDLLQKDENKLKIKTKKTKEELLLKPVAKKNKPSMSEFDLSFGEINKDLKKGRIKIDRKLDLHGYSLNDAYEKFKLEVVKTYNKNKRCILVITGKGNYLNSNQEYENNPKLYYGKIKNSIISWINEKELKNYILTYQNAGIEHGGDGAIFVYLRKRKT